MDDIYSSKQLDAQNIEMPLKMGSITEKDKFLAAKQILFGLGVLYVITLIVFLIIPDQGSKLIDICTTTFPPLATLILVAYFRDKTN